LIIDAERRPPNVEGYLRALFKLTRTEARVASAITSGARLASVAESLEILLSTARTHLHRIFEKTETRRQAELVKTVERIAVLRSEEL
jgi:DNA-binding CsgD family transcriptional regulator